MYIKTNLQADMVKTKHKSSGQNHELTETRILVSFPGCVILTIPGYCLQKFYKLLVNQELMPLIIVITRNFLVKPGTYRSNQKNMVRQTPSPLVLIQNGFLNIKSWQLHPILFSSAIIPSILSNELASGGFSFLCC